MSAGSGAGGLLVTEWLGTSGGADRVFHRLAGLFPEADLLCLWNESYTGARPVRETVLARTPLRGHKALALPFMPAVWRRPQPAHDWALVCTHLFAHHVNVTAASPECRKLLYVHTPARYLWEPDVDPRGTVLPARLLAPALRARDVRRAAEADVVVANSRCVRDRIRRHWGRDAQVIHPPVDARRLRAVADWADVATPAEQDVLAGLPAAFLLGASRFVSYKRLEVVIRAGEAAGLPVVLAGRGPEERSLRAAARSAGVPVTVLTAPTDAALYALYQRATVYLFPAVEDFGLMPVEAMALGTPVAATDRGGASESVLPAGGTVFASTGRGDLRRAVEDAARLDPAAVAAQAVRFDPAGFDRAITALVASTSGTRV